MEQQEIHLRKLRSCDKTKLAQLANNKRIWENVRDRFPYPYTEKDAEDFIELQSKSDMEKVFVICYNGQFCGLIGLIFQKDVYRKSAEIGYWLGESFWRKGIATTAVGLIIQIAFEDLKLMRIFAGAFQYNVGSMRVLEKNGFKKEGIAKKAVFKNGTFWDEHRYAFLAKVDTKRVSKF